MPPPSPEAASAPHPNGGRPYFLVVGRLEKLKGIQDVIPTFTRGEGPDLLIVGDGAYRGPLVALAAGAPRVRFLGRQPYAALGALYHHATALVTASLCYETFGQVVMEAFAHGTPVISRRLGALAELVEASDAGLLFDTEAELAEAVRTLAADRTLRDRLGALGRRHYEEVGTAERHLDRYLALVEERLAAGRRVA